MKKILLILILAMYLGACASVSQIGTSSVTKRPSLSQIQKHAHAVILDYESREASNMLSEEEHVKWDELKKVLQTDEIAPLIKYSAKPITTETILTIAMANEFDYSMEDIDNFLELELYVKNPYCEKGFMSFEIFQVLNDYVLVNGCKKTDYNTCDTSHGRIFMFPKRANELYFDWQIIAPLSEECPVYAGTFKYTSKNNNEHTVPIILFEPKRITKDRLEALRKIRQETLDVR